MTDWGIVALLLVLGFMSAWFAEVLRRVQMAERIAFLSDQLRQANAEVDRLSEGVSRR